MPGNTASLTFRLFGVDVNASRTISGVGVAAAGTAHELETLAVGTGKFVAAAGAAGVASVGLAGVLGVGLAGAIGGVGILFAAQADKVKETWGDLGSDLKKQTVAMSGPVQTVLVGLAGDARKTFDGLRSTIGGLFKNVAPLVDVLGKGLLGAVSALVAGLSDLLDMAAPIVRVFAAQLVPLTQYLVGALRNIIRPLSENADAFGQLISLVAQLLWPLSQIIGLFVRLGAQIMPVFSKALLFVADALRDGLAAVLPVVGRALNQILPALAQLAGVVLKALAQVLVAVVPVLARLVVVLAGGLAKALPNLIPALLTLVDAVSMLLPALVPLIPPIAILLRGVSNLIPPLALLAAQLIVALTPALTLVVKGISLLASWLGVQLARAVAYVTPYIVAVAKWLSDHLGPAVQAVGNWIRSSLLPVLVTIGTFLLTKVIPPILQAEKAFYVALWPALKTVWTAITTQLLPALAKLWPLVKVVGIVVGVILYLALTKVLPVILYLAGHVLGFLISTLGKVIGWIGNLIGALAKAIIWVGRIDGAIIRAFTNAGRWLLDAGGKVIQGFWNGVKDRWNAFVGWLKKHVPGWVRSALGIHSPPKWAVDVGRDIINGIVGGLQSGKQSLLDFFKDIGVSIASLVGGVLGGGLPKGGSIAENVKAGQLLAGARGWVGAQWEALFQLWSNESGWNNWARNPSSGAFGIPQALPPSKMGAAANPPRADAAAQIFWGLNYIQSRYGSPLSAWAAWLSRSPHWYAGGMAPTMFSRPTLIGVGEAGPETVTVTPRGRGASPALVVNVTVNGVVGDRSAVVGWVRQGIREGLRQEGKPVTV